MVPPPGKSRIPTAKSEVHLSTAIELNVRPFERSFKGTLMNSELMSTSGPGNIREKSESYLGKYTA